MNAKRLLAVIAVIFLAVGTPFAIIHFMAAPDDAPISPLQHFVAALANFFGPWGVAIVRVVDFPNAGFRSFSWVWAVGLTLLGAVLLVLLFRMRGRGWQILLAVLWAPFAVVWFGVGLRQIADGLL